MKTQKFLIIFFCFLWQPFNGIAQNKSTSTIHYIYDDNGNRILRWIEVMKITESYCNDSISQDSLVTSKLANSEVLNTSFSIFPNPTQGLLDLKITGLTEGVTAEYVFISLTGQELLRRKTVSPITQIDISNFTPGTYFVNVFCGEIKEIWKIIKR